MTRDLHSWRRERSRPNTRHCGADIPAPRYFATYEILKRELSGKPGTLPNGEPAPAPPLSLPAVMAAGGTAGVAMWALAIPPDVSGVIPTHTPRTLKHSTAFDPR
jgi:hypothetical protein